MQFRHLWVVLLALTLWALPGAVQAAENNTDRPGADYNNFDVPVGGGWRECESACTADRACRAWTYVKPTRIFPPSGGNCFLKNRVPAANPDACCVSGVKETGGTPGGGGGGGGRGITLYEDVGFGGGSQAFDEDVANLDAEGWNDIVSSFRIRGGAWEVCSDANFRGRCEVFSADQDNLVPIGWNDRISSIRRARSGGGGGGGRDGISVFEDTEFSGGSETFSTDQPNLVASGWNDVISSFRIRGGAWEVCEDVDYRGRCRTFASDNGNLVPIGWNDRISSLRRVRDGGGGGPGPGPGDTELGPRMRDNTDRPGGDYRSFTPVRGAGPNACEEACDADRVCRAWSFQKPAGFGERPRCNLKGVQSAERLDPRFISGVSSNRDAIGAGMEDNTDRPGSDYRTVDIPPADANPRACQLLCERDPTRCRAWTYVRPGAQDENAKCYLKRPAPPAERDACCVSGQATVAAPPPPPRGGSVDGLRRTGRELFSFRTRGPAEECRAACEANARCTAWTYIKPGYSGRQAKCFLWRGDTTMTRDACCVSSSDRTAGPAPGREVIGPGMRDGFDRPGFDLRPPFPLMRADPALCQSACFSEDGCRAWVYARPGTRGPRAVCYLKSVPGPRTADPCCVVGGRSSLF